MKLLINHGDIGGSVSPTLRAVYYKAGIADILFRNDGLTRPGIIEIYEVTDIR